MPLSQFQRQMALTAGRLGYKFNESLVPLENLDIGENVIILTKKGEVTMTGKVEDMMQDDSGYAVMVGERWFHDDSYNFRRV